MRRGITREPGVGNQVVYRATTSEGKVAWTLALDPDLYPLDQHAKILRLFERALLNPVDAPVTIVTGSNARVALPKTSIEDPYQIERRPPTLVR